MSTLLYTTRGASQEEFTQAPPPETERPQSVALGSHVAITGAGSGPGEDGDHVSPEMVEGLPISLVRAYADRAVRHSRVREVDPGVWVATVVGLEGAYGDGASEDEALDDLREAVAGWVAVRRRLGLKIPALDGLDLNVPATRRNSA